MDLSWFQLGSLPANQMTGTYHYGLVTLSYVIAVMASYVALDLAGRLRVETNRKVQIYWLLGGSFAMGAGIWSMHFIGMLAFIMPMPMDYDFGWTISSLIIAILASSLALYLLKNKNQAVLNMIIGGVFIGLGIATMHYMGMTAMNHVSIHYLPSLFFLSILIAIVASEAALWLALKTSKGSSRRQFYNKCLSALVMGAAICGMHYTGMAAAIFTPLPYHEMAQVTDFNPFLLSYAIAIITMLIIGVALTASIYNRQLSTAIQNEKEFLDAILNNIQDGIIAIDAAGKVKFCNTGISQFAKIYKGLSYKDLNQYFQLRLPLTDAEIKFEQRPLTLAFNGEHVRNQEYHLYYKDKLKRNVIIDGQPIMNEGNKLGALIIIRDVTNIKENEKLKKEFVSIVSHELRTPLTSIRGSLSLLVSSYGGELPEKIMNLLQIANNNTNRLIRLINDILDVEKIEAGRMDYNFQEIDIVAVIKTAIDDVKSIADKNNVTIHFDDPGRELLKGDFDKLVQVIVNLLSNAIRFSDANQTVTVKLLAAKDTLRVCVVDHGPGIPSEFQNKIFTKFSQADSSDARKKGGTGLGLNISKSIVERHGGHINYESIPNEMTCFYFDLPREIKQTTVPALQTQVAKAQILICDSNPDSAELLQQFLQKHAVVSEIALSVAEARKLLQTKSYQLLAMDLIMHDYDGIKFISELRENRRTETLPIIVISTQVDKSKQQLNGNAFPIIDWLQKPLKEEKLTKILEYLRSEFKTNLPNVLCVDDDPDIINILQELLANEAKVKVAHTLEEARRKIKTSPFDLIVLDLKLPDGFGTDLLPSVNCNTNQVIPVVVFSAYELDRKYAHLVQQALLKSRVSNDQLLQVLESVLASKEQLP